MIQVGFASGDITPALGFAIPGGFAPRASSGVVDPLQLRAAVVATERTAVAIVGVDAVALQFESVRKARRCIEQACGIPARNVTIAASHTHCGGPACPVLGTDADAGYCALVAERIVDTVVLAHSRLQPAKVVCASARCGGWAFNRRFRMRHGGVQTNPGKNNPDLLEPAGPVDSEVGLIGFCGVNGRWLGTIANFACHATVMWGDKFSADYPAYWQRAMQAAFGPEFTLVFLNGACGDINQLDFRNPQVDENGIVWAEKMGAALASAGVNALVQAQADNDADIAAVHGATRVAYRRPSPAALAVARACVEADGPWDGSKWLARDVLLLAETLGDARGVECQVDITRIGAAVIAAAPWQPFCDFGLRIKAASHFKPTLIAAFANGMLGYVPTPQGFEDGGYEPTLCRGSKLQPDAGDRIVAETERLLFCL